jgi:hypothetical protein
VIRELYEKIRLLRRALLTMSVKIVSCSARASTELMPDLEVADKSCTGREWRMTPIGGHLDQPALLHVPSGGECLEVIILE